MIETSSNYYGFNMSAILKNGSKNATVYYDDGTWKEGTISLVKGAVHFNGQYLQALNVHRILVNV